MSALRINGVAGDFNRDDVEPGLGQDAPEKRHEIPVADTPKRGFDETLTRPQYSADQRTGHQSLCRRRASLGFIVFQLHLTRSRRLVSAALMSARSVGRTGGPFRG
jgi:hypothetical protein